VLEEFGIGKVRRRLNVVNHEHAIGHVRNNGILDIVRISNLRAWIVAGFDIAADSKVDLCNRFILLITIR
jgi:hypothetical protein